MTVDNYNRPVSRERSALDLIQLVRTRAGGVSNFALMLGAGASVSSGIRSGQQLVADWREKLYRRYCASPVVPYDATAACEFLVSHHSDWYSRVNEYSCLFEKLYHLPSHRRIFVENEVCGKSPSLGYAYLTKLIEHRCFDTVLTPNYDDLLNEAFHRFSDERPIICAHDSGIESLTVSSNRPKGIKLHGDYLFDRLKCTKRETERLDPNTARKLEEFAKNYGLIVIGYSGNDRSIMDILKDLLKQDECYKNGIYWCLRENESPSEQLADLLSKDRVYWTCIDGFDEIMAQLHRNCLGAQLPVDVENVSRGSRRIISEFCNNPLLLSSRCPVIQEDLGRLRNELALEEAAYKDLSYRRADHDETQLSTELNDRDSRKLADIWRQIRKGDLASAQEHIQQELDRQPDGACRTELLRGRLYVELQRNDYVAGMQTCTLLLERDPHNAHYLHERARCERSPEARIKAFTRLIELNPYYSPAYRSRAAVYEKQLQYDPRCDSAQILQHTHEDYKKSLSLHACSSNSAWAEYGSFLLKSRETTPGTGIEKFLRKMRVQNAYSPAYLRLAVEYVESLEVSSAASKRASVLSEIDLAIERSSKIGYRELVLLKLCAYMKFGMDEELIELVRRLDVEGDMSGCLEYTERRAEALAERQGKIFDAIRTLEGAVLKRANESFFTRLMTYLCYVGRYADAQRILEQHGAALGETAQDDLKLILIEESGRFDEALRIIRRRKRDMLYPLEMAGSETHALLKLRLFNEVEAVAEEFVTAPVQCPERDAVIINREIARMWQKQEVDRQVLRELTERKTAGGLASACAFLLLGERDRAAAAVIAAVHRMRTMSYAIDKWAIFDRPEFRSWLIETLQRAGLDPGLEVLGAKKNFG